MQPAQETPSGSSVTACCCCSTMLHNLLLPTLSVQGCCKCASAKLLQRSMCKCKAAAEEHVQVQGCCCCTCTCSSCIMQQRKHAAHQKAAMLHAGLFKIVKNYFSRIYHVGKIFVQRVLSCKVYSAQESLECSYSFHALNFSQDFVW